MFFIGSASTKHQISTEVSVLGDEIAFLLFVAQKYSAYINESDINI